MHDTFFFKCYIRNYYLKKMHMTNLYLIKLFYFYCVIEKAFFFFFSFFFFVFFFTEPDFRSFRQ